MMERGGEIVELGLGAKLAQRTEERWANFVVGQ